MKTLTANMLSVSPLHPNPRVAALLPSELAHRYHALPIAVDGERVTVAMAHPEDADARQAVIETFGDSICLVKANVQEIDRFIAELWPQNSVSKLKIMPWFPIERSLVTDRAYAQSVCNLLGGELLSCEGSQKEAQFWGRFGAAMPDNRVDLLIFRSPDPPLIKRLLLEPAEQSYVNKFPTSLLVVREPHWPIRKILLVLHDPQNDDSALTWSIRFARPSRAAVTILPLLPAPPGMFAQMQTRHSIAELLARDYPLGAQLRRSAQQLAEWNIDGKLKLRNEPPDQQVRCEVMEGNYDLIIVGAQTQNTISRWILGQLVNPLLQWADRPLLITKSPSN
jgi:hypothetical protein